MKHIINFGMDLKKQILLVTILPLFLLSLVLTTYFIWEQDKDINQSLMNTGDTIATLISTSAHAALLTKDPQQIQNLNQTVNVLNDVADIILLDTHYNIVTRSKNFDIEITPNQQSVYINNQYYYFVKAINAIKTPKSGIFSNQNSNGVQQIIGWVLIVIEEDQFNDHYQNIILSIISVILLMLLIAFYFSNQVAKKILDPLSDITSVVESFQKGIFSARVKEDHNSKLNTLAIGINKMAVKIQDATASMEIRVDSATRRLQSTMHHLEQQNEALKITKEKEIEANQAKDQFLARMSHELRTPLTSVLGFSKMLQETKITPEQIEPIRIINHTSQLLLSLIDNILDYSKLQKEAIDLEKIDFNLETAVLDILEMQAPMAHSKGLELSLISSNDFSYDIKGDPTRFKQIISNLISNAIKFTDKGSVAVTTEIQKINDLQSIIILSVTDTGIGISDDQLERLFKAFGQADVSITRRFGGSGLGLIIAKALAQKMGGKLDIYSKKDKGTNVTLQIPTLVNVQPLHEDPPLNLRDTILVFDENHHTRRSLALMLERKQYNYRSISNIDELVENIALYQHIIIGVQASDYNNELINTLIPLITENNKIVTIAVPNGHPLPPLPSIMCIINKPIRPETLTANHKREIFPLLNDTPSHTLQKLTIVVAEDNAFNQILISRILSKNNITVFLASNGKEAIELINKHQPDLAILDLHMPVMDGFEATSIIRKNSDIPIISLTANIIEQDHHRITLAGSNCIVLKPINDVELIANIRRLTSPTLNDALSPLHSEHDESDLLSTPTETRSHPNSTNINDYDLDISVLKDELTRLCSLLELSFREVNYREMRDLAHQLVGLAGLYELPEIEISTIELQKALKNEDIKSTWSFLYQLKRIIVQETDQSDV